MKRYGKYIVGFAILTTTSANAQEGDSSFVTNAVNIVKKHLQPDHQSQFFQVKIISKDSLLVETTSKDAIKQLDSLLPSMTKVSQLLPEQYSDKKNYGIIQVSVSNHRDAPAQAAEMLTQGLMGMPVKILKRVNADYLLVQTPDDYVAYVDASSVILMTENEKKQWQDSPQIIFTQLYGTVYTSHNVKSLPISDIVAGDKLKYNKEVGNFYEVTFPNGKMGYVVKNQAEKYQDWETKINATFSNIYATGQRLLGVPYLWGGTSMKGLDCSGFMRTIFSLNGVMLPRDASQQARIGQPVDIYANGKVEVNKAMQNLLPGDLLFFGTKRPDGSDRVTHVAMYVGNGKFIQSTGFVKISAFSPSAPDYDAIHVPQFLSARRILTNVNKSGITVLP